MKRALLALLMLLAAAALNAAPTSVTVQVFPVVNGIVTPTKSAAASFPGDQGKVLTADSSAASGASWVAPSSLTTGTSSTVTIADAGGDTTTWCLFGTSATGNLGPVSDGGCTYNATTNVLTAGGFAGLLTGNVTGNADTATALAANGGNCSAGQYPLGVDASGAVESCTAASPTSVDYLVGTADGTLSGEIAVGTSPGGELGGTWANPTIDDGLTVTGWDLGTPLALVATNATGTAAALTAGTASAVDVGGITGLGSNVSTWLATPSNANFIAALTGESGTSGAVVLTDSPYIEQCVYTTADQTAIGTSYANVTSLSVSVAASTNYKFEATVWADSDATTTGIDVAVNGPASPTQLSYGQHIWTAAGTDLTAHATTYDADTASGNSAGTTQRPYEITAGLLRNGSNAGTLAVRLKRENVGTGPNSRAGGRLCVQQIN